MFKTWYILSVVKVYNAEFITIIAKTSWVQHRGHSEVLERRIYKYAANITEISQCSLSKLL